MSKLFDTLVAGGITIIPLMICSFLVVTLAIERAIFWSRIKKQQKRIIKTALNIYQDDPTQAKEFLQQHIDLPIARIYLEALSIPNATPSEFVLALDARTQSEIPKLKRFNNIFEIIVGLGGISEALISTAVGLVVAVIALIAASIFRSLYAQQIAYFDECCTQLELQHLRSHRQQTDQQAHQQVNIHV